MPDKSQVLLFTGLDLTSQTGSVGVFYKGYFYDYREDIQSDFSDIGHALSTNATKIGQTLGFDPDAAFADGINPTGGKNWRNFLPGHFAFDSEAATMAGGRGVTFATTDDARPDRRHARRPAQQHQHRQSGPPDAASGLRILGPAE